MSSSCGWFQVLLHQPVKVQCCFVPAGLDKLMEAEQSVSQLSEELVVREQELAVATETADKVLQEVTVKAEAAQTVRSFYSLWSISVCFCHDLASHP